MSKFQTARRGLCIESPDGQYSATITRTAPLQSRYSIDSIDTYQIWFRFDGPPDRYAGAECDFSDCGLHFALAIANTGAKVFCFEVGYQKDYLCIFDENDEVVFHQTLPDGQVTDLAISECGQFVCYATGFSRDETISNRLFVFNAQAAEEVCSFSMDQTFRHGGLPIIETITPDHIVFVLEGQTIRVEFSGEVIDRDELEDTYLNHALQNSNGFFAYSLARDKAPTEAIPLLDLALSKELSKKHKTEVYKLLGENYEAIGDLDAAIQSYDEALYIDSKAGVKRQRDKLQNIKRKQG